MDQSRGVYPLDDFQDRAPEFLQRLKATGEPIALTINGEVALVVQDATSYQRLIDVAEKSRTEDAIRAGIEEMKAGLGRPAEDVFADIRRDLNIPREL